MHGPGKRVNRPTTAGVAHRHVIRDRGGMQEPPGPRAPARGKEKRGGGGRISFTIIRMAGSMHGGGECATSRLEKKKEEARWSRRAVVPS